MAAPAAAVFALLLLAVGLNQISGSMYDTDSKEEEISNDIPVIATDKRASNLGSRMCQLDSRNCGAFNLGKKFIGYQWLRSMESRQRRTPFYIANYRPHESTRERDNDAYYVKSYRY